MLWRSEDIYLLKRNPDQPGQRLPSGTSLFEALREASEWESKWLEVDKKECETKAFKEKDGTLSYFGEAWQHPPGAQLLDCLGLPIEDLSQEQKDKLSFDCCALLPNSLAKSKQLSAEIKKVDVAIKWLEKSIIAIELFSPTPVKRVNPLDTSHPLSVAYELRQSLVLRQREHVLLAGSKKLGKRQPERIRNAYLTTAAEIFLRWYDDDRPKSELGIRQTEHVSDAIPSTNNGKYHQGPVWDFLEELFSKLRRAHQEDEALKDFYTINCRTGNPVKLVSDVRDRAIAAQGTESKS